MVIFIQCRAFLAPDDLFKSEVEEALEKIQKAKNILDEFKLVLLSNDKY